MDINRKTAYLVLVDRIEKRLIQSCTRNHQMVINVKCTGRGTVYGVLKTSFIADYYI